MKTLLAITVIAALAAIASQWTPAGRWSDADVAKLPQDKVLTIKEHCALLFPEVATLRTYCEAEQYTELKDSL
jgi:hypothetical protein